MHSKALPPEKSGGEPSVDFLTQSFWQRKFVCCGLAGSFCGASDPTLSKYDGRSSFLHSFVLCSVFGLVMGIWYFLLFFVMTIINTTKLALAANPAMPTSLAEISGGEKKWNALWGGLKSQPYGENAHVIRP